MRRRSNRQAVRQRAKKGFNRAVLALNDKMHEYITIPRNWAGFESSVTHRANGETVIGSYRNIEDLGNLASSQSYVITEDFKCRFEWDGNGVTPVVPVFFGYRTEKSFVAGRDWITPSIAEVDLPYTFTIGAK